jgi:hypothetical protein
MTNTSNKLKKHPKIAEILDSLKKGSMNGPQISTAFRTEVLELLDCTVISPNMPKDENSQAQVMAWISSGEFTVHELTQKLAEMSTVTCCGSNETGRLWSPAWFRRIEDLEQKTGYELKYSVYELWMAFCDYFTEDEKKGSKKDQKIAELEAQLQARDKKKAKKTAKNEN